MIVNYNPKSFIVQATDVSREARVNAGVQTIVYIF